MKLLGMLHADTSAPKAAEAGDQGMRSGWGAISDWRAPAKQIDPQRTWALHHRLLLLLVVARLMMLLTGLGMLWAFGLVGGASFPWLQFGLVAACVTVLTGPVCRRHARHEPISEDFILVQLLADVVLLCFVFHQSGGVENPFLVFFTIPVTLAAYAVSPRRLLTLVGAVGAAILFLGRFHNEVDEFNEATREVSEVIALAMLTYFAYTVARLSRSHVREVARARETAMGRRGRQAMQTVAAQAADAVSSPLATMSILVHEMDRGHMPSRERAAALGVLEQQIALCKANLSALLDSVGQPRGDTGQRSDIAEVLRSAACECELMDPRLAVVFDRPLVAPPAIVDERSLFDAFVLMIQHCAHGAAGDAAVRVDARWSTTEIRVKLCAAAPVVPGEEGDSDIDGSVELAASLVGRFGGALTSQVRDGKACLRVRIPIAPIGFVEPVGSSASTGEPDHSKQHSKR